MIQYWKTFYTYLLFPSTLIGLRPELQGLQALIFGTDEEKALVDAFSHEFHYAIYTFDQVLFYSLPSEYQAKTSGATVSTECGQEGCQ